MPTTTIENRLASLTGIRAVAALLVFWHHGAGLYGSHSSGMVGVSLFYLLSGFVMAWADRDDDTAALFFRRRIARIYPAYAVAVTVALLYAAYARGISPKELLTYTLLQSWVPDESIYFAASAVFWSLSCEAFFYAVFPLVRRIVRAVSNRALWMLIAGSGAISVAVGVAGIGRDATERLTWAVVVFPPVRLPEFVIGVCLGALVARGWRPNISVMLAWVLAIFGVVAAIFVPYSLSRYAITLIPFATLIVALAAADLRGQRVFTQHPRVVALGTWSYCFYLLHLVVIMVATSVNEHVGLPTGVVLGVSLAGAWVAARILHVQVEERFQRKWRPGTRA